MTVTRRILIGGGAAALVAGAMPIDLAVDAAPLTDARRSLATGPMQEQPVFVTSNYGNAAGYDLYPGNPILTAPTPITIISADDLSFNTPLVANGSVFSVAFSYSGADANMIIASYDAATGEQRWSLSDYETNGFLAISDGHLVLSTRNENGFDDIVALDVSDGSEVWRFSPPADGFNSVRVSGALVTHDKWVYAAYSRGGQASDGSPFELTNVFVLSARTGRIRRTIPDIEDPTLTMGVVGDLVVAEDVLLVAGYRWLPTGTPEDLEDFWVTAFDAVDGRELWKQTHIPGTPLLRAADGLAYFLQRPADDILTQVVDLKSGELIAAVSRDEMPLFVYDGLSILGSSFAISAFDQTGASVWEWPINFDVLMEGDGGLYTGITSNTVALEGLVLNLVIVDSDNFDQPRGVLSGIDMSTGEALWQIAMDFQKETKFARINAGENCVAIWTDGYLADGTRRDVIRLFSS
jgi:outer membrane protein assembly factor BamB